MLSVAGQFRDDVAIAEASDSGEVEIQLLKVSILDMCAADTMSNYVIGCEDRISFHRGHWSGRGRTDNQNDGVHTAQQ